MSNKNIVVNVHKSIPLLEAVLSAIKVSGKKWTTAEYAQKENVIGYIREGKDGAVVLGENSGGDDYELLTRIGSFSKYIHIDAATEFGKLIELLEEKPEIRIENITNEGDHGIVGEDKKRIKVGCREITREKVKEVYEKMFN